MREDVERRQSNTIWPDSMRNAASVDGYLWKRDPKAPTVQRVGAVIFGVVFLLFAAAFAYLANYAGLKLLYLFTIAAGYVRLSNLRNAFKPK